LGLADASAVRSGHSRVTLWWNVLGDRDDLAGNTCSPARGDAAVCSCRLCSKLLAKSADIANKDVPDKIGSYPINDPGGMYLGQALVLLGAMVYLQHLIALIVVPLFLAYITRLQILPEERALMARFPEAYAQYRRRVPRWL